MPIAFSVFYCLAKGGQMVYTENKFAKIIINIFATCLLVLIYCYDFHAILCERALSNINSDFYQ